MIYLGSINAGAIKNILVHTFAAGDTITFTSTQDGELTLSNNADTASGTKINCFANTPITIDVSSFGVDFKTNHYLNAVNLNGSVDAQYKLELM